MTGQNNGERCVNIAGVKIKMGIKFIAGAVSTIVSALVVMIGIAVAWGMNDNRLKTLEERGSPASAEAIKNTNDKLSKLAEDQAAVRATVEAVRQQQRDDRVHFDRRLDNMLDVLRSSGGAP